MSIHKWSSLALSCRVEEDTLDEDLLDDSAYLRTNTYTASVDDISDDDLMNEMDQLLA